MAVEHAFVRLLSALFFLGGKRVFTLLAREHGVLPTPQGLKCDSQAGLMLTKSCFKTDKLKSCCRWYLR